MRQRLLGLLGARKGHFRLESGHHGELWLDLDSLFLRPGKVRRFAAELARLLSSHDIEAVCGPLLGGALVAEMIAAELDVEFYYSERSAQPRSNHLYAVKYRIPSALRGKVSGRRVAIVDDVINAGSAVRATLADLLDCGARPVAIGALLVLGSPAPALAADHGLPLERIASLPGALWEPTRCPLCAARTPLEHPAG
jgi:orotate phosphoribosyltransferase